MLLTATIITVCFIVMDVVVIKTKQPLSITELVGVFTIWWLLLIGSFGLWALVLLEYSNVVG